MASDKYWEMVDTGHPDYVTEVVALINWSENCESPTPLCLFLDLVGWSETQLGDNLCQKMPDLGYIELDYLADALKEYAKKPTDVYNWLCELMEEEIK
jgi:hypothetical protein